MKTLHRYVFREILKLFLLFFIGFSFLVLMNKAAWVAKTVLGYGISPFEVAKILFKMIPSFFGVVIPVSLLLSSSVAVYLMASKNEIVVMKACGVSTWEILKPTFLLSFFLSILTFFSLMYLMPRANVSIKKQMKRLLQKKLSLSIVPNTFSSNFPGITFYAEKTFPKRGILENFMVCAKKKSKQVTIFAKFGRIRVENGTVYLDIDNGQAQVFDWKKPSELKILKFKSYTLIVHRFAERLSLSSPKYKTLPQLLKKADFSAKFELFKRLALSISPLFVGLLAVSFALCFGKDLTNILMADVITLLAFYTLFTVSKHVAKRLGVFSPLLSDVPLAVATLVFCYVAVKEKFASGRARW